MESGELHIIEQINSKGSIEYLDLSEMTIAKIPEILFDQPLKEVEIEFVVCPVEVLRDIFQIESIERLTINCVALSADNLEDEIYISSIPEDISNLQNLKELDLYDNSLTALPDGIKDLQHLHKIDLGHNEFQTDVFNQLPHHLARLDVSSNPLGSIPDEISDFKKLKVLTIEHGQLHWISSKISELKDLVKLNLNYNPLTDLTALCTLNALQELTLKSCGFHQIPAQLTHLEQLRHLDLQGNEITDTSSELNQLQYLEVLNLSRNQINRVHPEISSLSNLISLDLSNNKLFQLPKSMGELKKLVNLNVSNNKIQEFPSALYGMTNLERLDASWNVLSQIYPGIGKLSKLKSLHLHSCSLLFFTDDINELSNLQQLVISHNWLKKLPRVDNLKNLRFIDLSGLKEIEHPDTEVLKLMELEAVQEISLTYWKLTKLPVQLKELPQLKRINLGKCEVLKENIQKWRSEFAPIYLWF